LPTARKVAICILGNDAKDEAAGRNRQILDELRNGLPFPWTAEGRKAYEARAYAYEERWWQEHKHLLEGE
jgi:hypothetical protein